MLADCQSKTFTNARNECKESADFIRGKMSIFMSWARPRGFATRDGAMRISAWLKVYRGSSPCQFLFPRDRSDPSFQHDG